MNHPLSPLGPLAPDTSGRGGFVPAFNTNFFDKNFQRNSFYQAKLKDLFYLNTMTDSTCIFAKLSVGERFLPTGEPPAARADSGSKGAQQRTKGQSGHSLPVVQKNISSIKIDSGPRLLIKRTNTPAAGGFNKIYLE
jgi:hypothetical protein